MSTDDPSVQVKFAGLPLGARFRFQDAVFVKAGPLTAHSAETGASRMIPRAALVEPLDAAPTPAGDDGGRGSRALEDYHRAVLAALERLGAHLPQQELAQLRRDLDAARRRALARLKSSG